ncbi:MAG: ATP-binding protein [Dehalococcoidia bacterium]
MIPELRPSDLRWRCDEGDCAFKTTAEVEPLSGIVGQERALRAIELGLDIREQGYNLYVSGQPGSGRNTSMRIYLERLAPTLPAPPDWCYLRNSKEEYRPRAVELPAGGGPRFAREVESAVAHAVDELERLLESEQIASLRQQHLDGRQPIRDRVTGEIETQARELGFAIRVDDGRISPLPLDDKGNPLNAEQFNALPAERRAAYESGAAELNQRISQGLVQLRRLDRETAEGLRALELDAARQTLQPIFDDLCELLSVEEGGEIDGYLSEVLADLVERLPEIGSFDRPAAPDQPPSRDDNRQRLLSRYRVNVFLTRERPGAPVVFENSASHYSVFGRADYRVSGATAVSDHRMLQPGSLHRANGGFLVLQASDVFANRGIWEMLKRTLRGGEIRIEPPGEPERGMPGQSLSPEPIPLTAKVIVIGTPGVYQLAWSSDEDFRKLFKVKAEFAPDMDRSDESLGHMASFVRRRSDSEGLPAFDRGAIARVIEHSARLAGHQDKLSTRFADLAEIVTEAAYWRGRRDGPGSVTREDVSRAIAEQDYRDGLFEDRLQRMIEDGTIRIRTDGEAVGQVNGISVYEVADHSFGRPLRITARLSLGEGEFVNLERETELSGRIHSKAFLSLVGYLQGHYGGERPLSFSASLSFEQIYDEVEGDSAASGELYALLSALAETPIKQGIAVTGSVNQVGEVQAVGGVIEKIEGYFQVCRAAGLTGEQGVIIPLANQKNLMLGDEVVEAVKSGRFHVWAVESIDQGIEILTGLPAGRPNARGSYPARSVHGRAIAHIESLLERQRHFAALLNPDPHVEAKPRRRARQG